jgi:RNA polymerase sigma-70 factor (ECF subfamily)
LVELFSDIIKRCRQGDRKAQEAIYNLLAGKMFAICLRYCANYEVAKDLLHDGFLTVFTKIEQFNNTGSFEGWVRRIFVNHAVEWCRNKSKLVMVDCDDDYGKHFVEPENDDYDADAYRLT